MHLIRSFCSILPRLKYMILFTNEVNEKIYKWRSFLEKIQLSKNTKDIDNNFSKSTFLESVKYFLWNAFDIYIEIFSMEYAKYLGSKTKQTKNQKKKNMLEGDCMSSLFFSKGKWLSDHCPESNWRPRVSDGSVKMSCNTWWEYANRGTKHLVHSWNQFLNKWKWWKCITPKKNSLLMIPPLKK